MSTCLVDSCDRPERARALCSMHYSRWKRTGDPLAARQYGAISCAVDRCPQPHFSAGWCQTHFLRWKKTGDPNNSGQLFGSDHPSWHGEAVGYFAVHMRVRKDRGPASAQTCAHCGCNAADWAYDNEDPGERISSAGLPFSVKGTEHYIPLCRPCHRAFDKQSQARRQGGTTVLHAAAS